MQGKAILRVRMAEPSKALRSGRSPLLWAWSFFEVKNYMQGKAILRVRMAEPSKALRSGRSPLLWAWAGQAVKGAAFMSKSTRFWRGMAEQSKVLRSGRSPLVWAWSFFEVKNYMQVKAILRVRMAEPSSGRSPLLWAWEIGIRTHANGWTATERSALDRSAILTRKMASGGQVAVHLCGRGHFLRLKTTCKGKLFCVSGWPSRLRRCVQVAVTSVGVGNTLPRVRMAERSKALRSGRSPLVWAWSFFEVKNYMQGKAILRVRMTELSKALRSGRRPLLWAWAGQAVKGAAFMSKSTRFWRGEWIRTHANGSGLRPERSALDRSAILTRKMASGNTLPRVRMAERSKALRSGRSPLVWAWDFRAVHLCGRGFEAHFCQRDSIQSFLEIKELYAGKAILRVRMDEQFKALQSGRSPLAWALVRIPLLTMYFFSHFLRLKNFMQGKAILRVRMAERSKALRSGRSPLLWAWVRIPLLTIKFYSHTFLRFQKLNVRENSFTCQDGRSV
ncbi:hypothetical protein TNCV_4801561 [Trichonephila clavipes]|nr:hypothetical protein TNCV_4801561 [Trichonephila clavipes]